MACRTRNREHHNLGSVQLFRMGSFMATSKEVPSVPPPGGILCSSECTGGGKLDPWRGRCSAACWVKLLSATRCIHRGEVGHSHHHLCLQVERIGRLCVHRCSGCVHVPGCFLCCCNIPTLISCRGTYWSKEAVGASNELNSKGSENK